jgi:hypothetical protein
MYQNVVILPSKHYKMKENEYVSMLLVLIFVV